LDKISTGPAKLKKQNLKKKFLSFLKILHIKKI
jgi:hypothetical protein